MKEKIGIPTLVVIFCVGFFDRAVAATQCEATEENKIYVCIEDRHGQVLPGQREWWWFVEPEKGIFSAVQGAEDLEYTKVYTCESYTKYDATIIVGYPFPYPHYAQTSTQVGCDTRVSVAIPPDPYHNVFTFPVWVSAIQQCLLFGVGPLCEAGW